MLQICSTNLSRNSEQLVIDCWIFENLEEGDIKDLYFCIKHVRSKNISVFLDLLARCSIVSSATYVGNNYLRQY